MKWILRILGITALVAFAFIAFGYVTMHLWNWLMPYLFNLPKIDFCMAIGLVVLSKIIFGSMRIRGGSGHWGHKKYWKAKWESMTPEEREQFKNEFAQRCKHKWGKAEAKVEANKD
jgi:hypothetical protein